MKILECQKNDILFQEGDRSNCIYLVIEGSVDILKSANGNVDIVGTVSRGQYVGEMSSIIDRRRTSMAKVATDGTRIRLLDNESFLRLVSSEPSAAYSLLSRFATRLHAASRRASDNSLEQLMRTSRRSDDPMHISKLTLFPDSSLLDNQISVNGFEVTSSPFVVGRKPEPHEIHDAEFNKFSGSNDRRQQTDRREDTGLPLVQLQLTDIQPFRLSRIHFMIQRTPEGGMVVRDLGSTLGTQVNDNYLGSEFQNDLVELNTGNNFVCAGGNDSPFRFRLHLQ